MANQAKNSKGKGRTAQPAKGGAAKGGAKPAQGRQQGGGGGGNGGGGNGGGNGGSRGVNKVILLGNLGAEPELRDAGGTQVCSLRLATTTQYKDAEGSWIDITEWHDVSVWGARGAALAKILSKGAKLYVEGELRTRSWEDDEGNKKYRTGVHAREVVLCDRKPQGQPERSGYSRGKRPEPDDDRRNEEDEIPF